jgi:hypothetical protein
MKIKRLTQKIFREDRKMKKVYNITAKLIGIIIITAALVGCAITEKDINYTWDQMKMSYKDNNTSMPRIIVNENKVYTNDGYPIRGMYVPNQHLVVLYAGWDYETIIHEFHHALGNDLGEKEYTYVDYGMKRFIK